MNGAHDPRPTFLLGQKLSELIGVTDPEERRFHVCGGVREPERRRQADRDPWQALDRDALCADAAGPSPRQRMALVCDAGLGKTTNLEWLQYRICRETASRQVPFLLRLDTNYGLQLLQTSYSDPEALLTTFAAEVARGAGVEMERLPLALKRLRSSSRVSLLIDGLDHALSVANVPYMLSELLASEQWRNCPVWISGRPHAFGIDSAWPIFADPSWSFCRVEPLAEPEIRFYLSRHAGGDWYDYIASEGRRLLAVPRLLRLVAGILAGTVQEANAKRRDPREAVRGHDLSTAADVYHVAYFKPGKYVNPRNLLPRDDRVNRRGLIASGLTGEAERIGLKDGVQPSRSNYRVRIHRTAALLGAIAFEMYAANPKAPVPTPNLVGVPEEELERFKDSVGKRLQRAGQGTEADFERDFDLLMKMNNQAIDFLLFCELDQEGVVWHDRTAQAFFAAYWAMKYGDDEDRRRLRRLVDANGGRLIDFDEFWTFAAELPDALVDGERWLAVFEPSYTPPQNLTCSPNGVQWHRRMIYRSFRRMQARSPGTIVGWRASYGALARGTAKQQRIHYEIEHGFRDVPPGVCQYGADPMAHPAAPGVPRHVAAFRMHQWQTTNEMFEEYDPSHLKDRWPDGEHPFAVERKRESYCKPDDGTPISDDRCPVVNVTWYDAWCFAAWSGYRLPSELEWEHACRAGTATAWHFGDCQAELRSYAWYGEVAGRGSTHPVGQLLQNDNKLFDMHGNVWEWCEDLFEPGAAAWARRSHFQPQAAARVLRGGSFLYRAVDCRSADRFPSLPQHLYQNIGFRLAAVPAVGAESSEQA